ncbi:ABC-type transport system involved in multi-copper enzyme maturation permease subunit [Arthrobacter stackebrandtii]|uniref:ABC-type transport system involved in multi-copper enzyme maturation permease subunit n=1 Tax=Arthrobacter stackebrandtii TaxID=272161 RepID=A0ABS4Z116_9MICC|nr:ABC transporter permease [Arthrobacter stackebrandtii]MBP2414696.1 ABC-type transport system involved in multi-copper enzyme maturation permease subunit [Arthrobacter stackebrandtii]PYH01787.1 ABC transporter permease [Arthrobacter stackebrandtii]
MRTGRFFLAELRKTATLPAAWAGIAVALLGSAAITVLNAFTVRGAVAAGTPGMVADTSAFEAGFAAMPIVGVVGAVVVGVTAIGSEYTADRAESGGARQISTTLAVAPQRLSLFTAKAAVVLTFVALAALLTIPGNIALAQAIIGDAGTETVSAADAVSRSLGTALYWALMGLLAFSITALARSGIIPLIVLIANGSVVSFSLLLSMLTPLAHWLPDLAGRKLFGFPGEFVLEGGLDPVPGAIVMAGWTAVMLVVSGVVFNRRDA